MDRLADKSHTVLLTQAVLLMLAMICAVTVVKSSSVNAISFHGRDFETIAGLRSTTEVFRQGGTYVLHDYSSHTPLCTHCERIPLQMDFGLHVEARGQDFFNRHQVTMDYHLVTECFSHALSFQERPALTGLSIAPNLPPPRN